MKRNDQNLLEDFGRCIEKVSNLIEEIDPCIIIYPIKGAVPIADLLRIINPSISGRYNEYIPTSSTIVDTNQVIYGWFRNFIEEEHVVGEEQSIITIDEVVSGSSIVRASKQIRRAINDYGRTKCITNEDLCKEIVYHSIAIKDKRNERDGKGLNNGYLKIRNIGFVKEVDVEENLVMDKPDLCPLRLVRIPEHRFGKNLPVMDTYCINQEYLNFLNRFASFFGQDLSVVDLQNPEKIRQSERFLPEKYKSLENYLSTKQ